MFRLYVSSRLMLTRHNTADGAVEPTRSPDRVARRPALPFASPMEKAATEAIAATLAAEYDVCESQLIHGDGSASQACLLWL